ncbi:MAG TPA: DUF4124 domain-containing protein [Nitrospira sp.]|nr:DUF4124 domain-containing protein [Nitrospira sp.]
MRSPFYIAVLFFLCVAVPAFATNQIYRYTDDSGTLNFTTELDSIPEKYRSRVIPLEPDTTPDVGALAPPPVLRVVKSSGEYRMGDHDTRTDAIRMAMETAKREALEQVATYLESVTEVKNLDVTRDEIQTYTAGVVMVLNQETSTRIEDGTPVFHVDLTAQVDQQEVIQAITALRENESAKQELISLRAETNQLRQQLDAANQALITANTPEEVQALTQQRQQLLNHIQADDLVSQAWTDWVYVTPIIYPYPAIGVRQVNGLLLQARQLHPRNHHLQVVQQAVTAQASALPPAPSSGSALLPPHGSLLVPSQGSQPNASAGSLQSLPSPLATPLPQSPLAVPLAPSPLAAPLAPSPLATPFPPSPLATPLPPSPLAAPLPRSPLATPLAPSPLAAPLASSPLAAPLLPPTIHQAHPPHVGQPNPPVPRAPFSSHSGGGHSGGHHGR